MNKLVLITGATSDLGRSIALEFAKNGYDLVLTYHKSEDKIKEIIDNIKSLYNVNIDYKFLDVQNEESIKELVLNLDRLDCLVNNAAYNNDCDFFDKTKDEFIKILDTNLVGPFLLSKYSYPLLQASNGSIVNVASTNGIDSMYIESLDYDASKAALINLTKNLASFMAPKVRVNAVAPGWIETSALEDMSLEFRGKELSKIAQKRFANPEEIAKVIYFVANDATYMTGSIVRVDGGKNNEL